MARVNLDEVDNYGNNSSSDWFKLADDGDVAKVQFLYDSRDDMEVYACHKVKIGDKERWVDCKRASYDDPADDCPFCAAGIPVKPVLILTMYDLNDQKVKIWERGKTFIKKMEALFNRYPNLSNKVFEIERQGAKGDKKTQYEIFPMADVEPADLSNIEKPEFMGSFILDKTEDEMQVYLDTGEFPKDEDADGETPARRRSFEQEEKPVSRRSRRTV